MLLSNPVRAQNSTASGLSLGVELSGVGVSESGLYEDSGYGGGLRIGYGIVPPLALEAKLRAFNLHDSSAAGDYQLFEANLGVRYHLDSVSNSVIPYAEAVGIFQMGAMDRTGVTPGPDIAGGGAGLGFGGLKDLSASLRAHAGAEVGIISFVRGRVENGTWVGFEGGGIRTGTVRITAGIDWQP